MPSLRVPRAFHLILAAGLALGLAASPPAGSADSSSARTTATTPARDGGGRALSVREMAGRPAVKQVRVVGRSVKGRKIFAYRVGTSASPTKAVVMSTMHGNEADTVDLVRDLRDGSPIKGADIWLVPVYNPDGLARGTRQNANGVDLNRNYPYRWLRGEDDSGNGPASAKETRLFMRFLDDVDPRYVVSFHQPLNAIDVKGARDKRFARTLVRELGIPRRHFDCGGPCHGTMTQWFNHTHDGFAITVELPASPSAAYLHGRGPRGTLRSLGAWRPAV